MRWSGALGWTPIFVIAFACSSSQPELASPSGSGDVASDEGGSEGADQPEPESRASDDAQAPSGPAIVAPKVGDPGNCCTARDERGCENEAVAQCVCAEGSYCCNTAWDTACVRAVGELGCGICPIGGTTVAPGESEAEGGAGGQPAASAGASGTKVPVAPVLATWSSCCEKQPHAGCGDALVEECVCYVDTYCCEKKWDRYCASEAEALGCASCAELNGNGANGQGSGGAGGQPGAQQR